METAHFETLENYKNFITNNAKRGGKEEEFKALCQIEAIRNSSALLTNAMFAELAEHKFCSVRVVVSEREYNFNTISKQMPMAMSGAVPGSIYLDRKFNKKLTGKLPYDYREDGERSNGEILDIRNQNILFDWLSFKMGINAVLDVVNICQELSYETIIPNTTWKFESISGLGFEDKNQLTLKNNNGYEIILKKTSPLITDIVNYVANKLLTNKKGKISIVKEGDSVGKYSLTEGNQKYTLKHQNIELLTFTAQINNGQISTNFTEVINQTKINELTKIFCLTQIDSFPLSVFNELTNEWYGITLLYLHALPHQKSNY